MRKIVVGGLLSLDGVAEDPNRFFTEWDDVVDAGTRDSIKCISMFVTSNRRVKRGSCQVLQLERNFAASESTDEEGVQVYPLGGANLEANQLLRPGLMELPRQGVLEACLGAEHRTTCRAAGKQLRHRVRVEHGLSQHDAMLEGFIPSWSREASRLGQILPTPASAMTRALTAFGSSSVYA